MKANHSSVPNKKLILHFDIDSVLRLPSRQNKDLYVYDQCANWVWGRLEKNNKEDPELVTGWKLASNALARQEPEPELVSYYQYLKQHVKPSEEEWEKLMLNLSKGPASKAKGEIEKTIKNITLPKTLFEVLKQENHPKNELEKKYLADGKYEILPAFYKVFLWLKKNKREFAICIKASNKDADHLQITEELNLFFNGEHPLYNGKNGTPLVKMDGNNKTKNFVLEDSHYLIVYGYDEDFIGSFGSRNYVVEKDPEMLKQSLKSNKRIKVCEDIGEIYSYFHAILAQGAFIYEVDPSKTIFIDPVDYLTQEIYFTVESQPKFYSCLGKQIDSTDSFFVTVDNFNLLRDVDYFIKKVEEKEHAREQEIQRIEKGEGQVQEENAEEGEGQKEEQRLSDAAYLKQNIVPILQGALRQVDLFRPQDPLGFIALYCLKNRQRIE